MRLGCRLLQGWHTPLFARIMVGHRGCGGWRGTSCVHLIIFYTPVSIRGLWGHLWLRSCWAWITPRGYHSGDPVVGGLGVIAIELRWLLLMRK
mgnify:CR=1 FL=1